MKIAGSPRHPLAVYLLWFLLIFLGIGGMYGGAMLIADPSGVKIQFPPGTIERLPFPNYFIPGVILLLGMAGLPLLTAFALWNQPNWKWPMFLNIYPEQHWAWTFSLYTGIILAIWINVQIYIVGAIGQIQPFYGLYAVALIICTLLPKVKQFYRVAPSF